MSSYTERREDKKSRQLNGDTQLRCDCGSLLARLVEQGVEIKCRRCKRQVILPIETKRAVRLTI